MIVSADPDTGGYTQHYYDSRGVVRLYAMSLADGVWTLTREAPDFSPLDFRQRFTGTFSPDQNTISGAWETGPADGGQWEHDFALTYRRPADMTANAAAQAVRDLIEAGPYARAGCA